MAFRNSYCKAVKGAAACCLPFPSLLRLNARTFAVLCPARFCGHPAFTPCPVLRTPRFYCLSTFVDTALLLSVHFCGHRAIYCLSGFAGTALLLPVRFCGHFPFAGNSKFHNTGIFNDAFLRANDGLLPNILVFTLNFSLCSRREIPVYWNFYRAFLYVNDGLLPNILAFTLNFSIRRQRKIPAYWNFYSVSLPYFVALIVLSSGT